MAPRSGSILKSFLGCLGLGVLVVGAFVLGGFVVAALFVGAAANRTEQPDESILSTPGQVTPAHRREAEIYRLTYAVGMRASREAERAYSVKGITDMDVYRKIQERHRIVYETMRDEGRKRISQKFDVSEATLEVIDRKGVENRWPLSEELPDDLVVPVPQLEAPFSAPSYDVQPELRRQEEAYQKVMAEKAKKEAAAAEAHRKEVEEASERERIEIERREAEARAAHAESMLRMGRNLERLKKIRGALDFYRKVVAECPDTPQAKVATEKIKALGGK
jgi:hypothetical protein